MSRGISVVNVGAALDINTPEAAQIIADFDAAGLVIVEKGKKYAPNPNLDTLVELNKTIDLLSRISDKKTQSSLVTKMIQAILVITGTGVEIPSREKEV